MPGVDDCKKMWILLASDIADAAEATCEVVGEVDVVCCCIDGVGTLVMR